MSTARAGSAHPGTEPAAPVAPREQIPAVQPDSGLLSPVRVGTAVEAAVGDTAWLQAMLDAEAALVRAQARCGTVPAAAAEAITAAARAELFDVRRLALAARGTANPVVGLVAALTAEVARRAPEAAEYVHRGSTSQDILDTGAMLVSARALRLVLADLRAAAGALARLAAAHRDTAMPGRTLALHAVPTTFGLKAAGWRQLVLDSVARLEAVADHGLPVSLGGAAGTLAGYLQYAAMARAGGGGAPADGGAGSLGSLGALTDAFAAETGLARPVLPWHALRTPIADLGAALAHTAGALGKMAADVQVMARTEVGEATEPGGAGRGASSAMPHKANPVLATLIRSAAVQVPALSSVLAQCMSAEDERSAGLWHAEWQPLRECLRLTGGAARAAAELSAGLSVHPARMRANLDATAGQIVSERLAAHLAPLLGRAAARDLLTAAALAARRTGRPLGDVLAEQPAVGGVLTRGELAGLLDPEQYTGVAGPLVDQALRQ